MSSATDENSMSGFPERVQHFDEETWQTRIEFAVTIALILFFGTMLLGN